MVNREKYLERIQPSKTICLATSVMLAFCVLSPEMFSNFYHEFPVTHRQPPVTTELAILIAAFGMLVSLVPLFVVAAFSSNAVTFVFSFIYNVFFIFSLTRPITLYFLTLTSISSKIIFFTITAVGAIIINNYGSPHSKKALFRFLFGASCTYLITLFIVAIYGVFYFNTVSKNVSALDARSFFIHPPSATVFLILDELSPEYSREVVSAIPPERFLVLSSEARKAGSSTTQAIPSMFSDERHDRYIPCGASFLCGKTGFSFKKLTATFPNTDVVGFYHPYCDIKSLRSCYRVTNEDISVHLTLSQFLMSAVDRIPVIGDNITAAFIGGQIGKAGVYDLVRQKIRYQAFNAPFWREGGFLLIHQLLPHPTGEGRKRSLKEEYEGNIEEASTFVAELAIKLEESFGDDYALIITSDHPLRTSSWCGHPTYSNEDCPKELPDEGAYVPFIVVTAKTGQTPIPVTDLVGVLKSGR